MNYARDISPHLYGRGTQRESHDGNVLVTCWNNLYSVNDFNNSKNRSSYFFHLPPGNWEEIHSRRGFFKIIEKSIQKISLKLPEIAPWNVFQWKIHSKMFNFDCFVQLDGLVSYQISRCSIVSLLGERELDSH